MTLHARDLIRVPEETARVARAAFPKGNVYMSERITEGTRNRGKQGYKVRRKGQDGAGTGLQ